MSFINMMRFNTIAIILDVEKRKITHPIFTTNYPSKRVLMTNSAYFNASIIVNCKCTDFHLYSRCCNCNI